MVVSVKQDLRLLSSLLLQGENRAQATEGCGICKSKTISRTHVALTWTETNSNELLRNKIMKAEARTQRVKVILKETGSPGNVGNKGLSGTLSLGSYDRREASGRG